MNYGTDTITFINNGSQYFKIMDPVRSEANMLTKAPRGTRDILPDEVYKWNYVEKSFLNYAKDLDIKRYEFCF